MDMIKQKLGLTKRVLDPPKLIRTIPGTEYCIGGQYIELEEYNKLVGIKPYSNLYKNTLYVFGIMAFSFWTYPKLFE